MAAAFPGAIATLTNPLATDKQNVVSHAAQHTSANDEIEAIETALGVGMANVVASSALDTDTTLAANSDTKIATQKAVKAYADAIVVGAGQIPFSYLDTDGTLAANSDTKIATQKAVRTYVAANSLAAAYPVGSIYMNASVSTNPATLLGFGTWSAFAAGRVLVGVGTSDTAYAAAATGGESTHTLTNAELPANTYFTGSGIYGATNTGGTSLVSGGGGAHNNMPPYIVVYMWVRTA